MKSRGRIILLSGTGGDRRLFPKPWTDLPGVLPVDWPAWRGETTLREIAARLIAEQGIGPDDIVAGTSLGGMVACEIANITPVAGIVLVAGAIHPREVVAPLRWIHPLIRIVPLRLTQRLVARWPRVQFRMFTDSEATFIREVILAIFRWEGLIPGNPVKVLRIHGRRDPVIRCPSNARVVLEAGHMVTISHAEACVAEVRRFAREISG
jgi:pimeloyl-ACP methyl ester carboxylesterase